MKNKARVIALFALVFCLSACGGSTAPERHVSPPSELFGAWGYESFDAEDGIWIYARIETLSGDRSGYLFEEGGMLYVRTPGWCLTPPLSYSNIQGSWEAKTEDTLILTYMSAKSVRDFRFSILYLDESEIHFRLEGLE